MVAAIAAVASELAAIAAAVVISTAAECVDPTAGLASWSASPLFLTTANAPVGIDERRPYN